MGLLVVFIIVFVLFYQRRMMAEKLKVREFEYARERDLLKAAIQSQENERRRISADLHDEVGATLSAIKMRLDQYDIRYPENEAAASHNRETRHMVKDAIDNVRAISHALTPLILERMGFESALRDHLSKVPLGPQVQTVLACEFPSEDLPGPVALALFRICQELFTNSIRHASAGQVTIRLSREADSYRLEYRDNGRGYTPGFEAKGLGLKSMESRVRLLEGSILDNSAPGHGTHLWIKIPRTA